MEHKLTNHHQETDNVTFGFWIYLMTDLLMFAVLFATFAVLRDSTHGGIGIKEIFDPPFVLLETLILLTSSFTSGLGIIAARAFDKKKTFLFLGITLALGIAFLFMEYIEFSHLIHEGSTPQTSAFLSAFFALLGTHGLHIIIGCLWMILLLVQMIRRGLTHSLVRKLSLLGIFWHFLDIVWIFIFTFVYLMAGTL